ncbi:low affinity iron permease family protein [Arthrobacter sp. OAP107]|uniref:low affinity iron permease family protein n=1 Tax=Arthrobacter sp. OAP107 TaxID=3156445 RepID=UPI003390C0F2
MITEKSNGDRVDFFTRFTSWTAKVLGHPWVFVAAVVVLVVWACTGRFWVSRIRGSW